jgi:hypothetical protein
MVFCSFILIRFVLVMWRVLYPSSYYGLVVSVAVCCTVQATLDIVHSIFYVNTIDTIEMYR